MMTTDLTNRIHRLERDLRDLRMDAAEASALMILSGESPRHRLSKLNATIGRTAEKIERSREILRAKGITV